MGRDRSRSRDRRDRKSSKKSRRYSYSESRSRSRGRERDRELRRRNRQNFWDAGGPEERGSSQHPAMALQATFAQTRSQPYMDQRLNKRSREVWVGNLLQGAVMPQHLTDFFTQMFNALPDYQQKYQQFIQSGAGPISNVTMQPAAVYAFVEFQSDELAATALLFNMVDFMGRPLKTGRPTGFEITGDGPTVLDVTPLRQAGLLPSTLSTVENPTQNKKQRELYFGNLPQGQVSGDSIKALLTPACELLPDYNALFGAPVINVNMSGEGKFCFVEFQNDRLATAVMPIFNQMEIFGRKMMVARPTGYVDPNVPANPLLANLTMLQNLAAGQMPAAPVPAV